MSDYVITGFTASDPVVHPVDGRVAHAVELAEWAWGAGIFLAAEVRDGRGQLVATVCQKGCVHHATTVEVTAND